MYPELEDPSGVTDPYAEWKGGEFIPIGSSFQATPQWQQPKGPYNIGPFSGPPGVIVDDLREFWAPIAPTSIDQGGLVSPPSPDNAAIYQAYAYGLGSASAPEIPTSGHSC